jgi:hypothetical protein
MLRQLVLGQISCRNTHHYPPGSEYVIASGIALVRPSSRGRTRHKPVPRRACRSRSADAYRDAHNIRGIRHQGNEPAVALQHHGPALGNCKAWEQRRTIRRLMHCLRTAGAGRSTQFCIFLPLAAAVNNDRTLQRKA